MASSKLLTNSERITEKRNNSLSPTNTKQVSAVNVYFWGFFNQIDGHCCVLSKKFYSLIRCFSKVMDIVIDWWALIVFSFTVLQKSNAKQAQNCFTVATV